MTKSAKKIAIIIYSVLVALIAIAFIVPFLIPQATIKSMVQTQIEQATGRKVSIDGSLRLKLFPFVGAYVEKVTLANPKDYPDAQPLLTFASMNVSVALMPLVSGEIHVNDLTLVDPQIKLHVSAAGVPNWTFGKETVTPPVPVQSQKVQNKDTVALPIPANLLLSHLRLTGGSVDYVNDATHEHWTIGNLSGSIDLNGLNSPFTVNGEGVWNQQTVSIKGKASTLASLLEKTPTQMEGSIETGTLGQFSIDGSYNKEHYIGKLKLSSHSLKALASWAIPGSKPIETQSPLATTITSDINCTPSRIMCAIKNANITVDSLKMNGTLLFFMQAGLPRIEAQFTAGQIDLNTFLPPAKQASLIDNNPLFPAAYAATTDVWSSTPFSVSALQAFNANINVKDDGIIYRKVHIGANEMHFKLEQKRLNVELVNAALYNGTANIEVAVDASAATPAVEFHTSAKGIETGRLLNDLTGSERVSGNADFQTNINGVGTNVRDIVGTLVGNGRITMPEGTVHGVNLGDMLHNVQSAFGAGGASGGETKFTNAGGTFTIAKGVVTNSDLAVTMPGMQAKGQGSVNLPAFTVSYRLTPQLTSGTGATAQAGLAVPVLIEGSLDNPSYRPDVSGMLKNAIQDPTALKQQLKNSKGVLGNPKDAIKNLKNMFQSK